MKRSWRVAVSLTFALLAWPGHAQNAVTVGATDIGGSDGCERP
jgi:hypothetical protein